MDRSSPRENFSALRHADRNEIFLLLLQLKAFRRVSTRYDKTDQSYRAMIHLAATWLALR